MAITAPEVLPQPIPNVRATPAASVETFGGGAGLEQENQQVQKISADVGNIAAFEKIRADQTAVQEANAKMSEATTHLLYDPQEGVLASRGTNAMAAHDQAWDTFRKTANDISSTLHGEQQVGAFNKYALTLGDEFNRQAMAHVSTQLEKHDANTFNAFVKNTTDLAAKSYGDPMTRKRSLDSLDDHTEQFARRNGIDSDQLQLMKSNIHSDFHEQTVAMMLNDPKAAPLANKYYQENKSDMDTASQDRVEKLLDVIPRQQAEAAKSQQEQYYKANMRQSMLDMFDGKLTLSEVQRRFREDKLDKSDYDVLASRLSKPDAGAMQSFLVSKPDVFNNIRQAQLTGSASPGEIQRMIAKGAAAKDITPDDGKYLMTVNSEKPPTPNDRYVEAQANNLRDFGSRYFAEKNFFGMETNKDKTSQEAEAMVQDFYSQVDKAKARGEDVDAIRDQIKKTAMQKRFPGLGNLDKAPDVVIDVKGNLTRLLNPDQHSGLKPRYRIVPTSDTDKEEK